MTLKPQFLVLNIATRYVLATLHFHDCIGFKSLVLFMITICFCEVNRFVALLLDAHIIKTSHASLAVSFAARDKSVEPELTSSHATFRAYVGLW